MPDVPPLEIRRSFYFEEFAVGQTITSPARTVTETDIVAFAALSGDWNPVHTDAVYAATTPYGQRVGHGLLALSIAVGLAVRMGFIGDTLLGFRGIDGWKFSAPLLINDTIHMQAAVSETRAIPRMNGGLVTLRVEILNQAGKVLQQGNWSVLVMSKP
jgi:3-hydroxybutyryl-CoA dehydratase